MFAWGDAMVGKRVGVAHCLRVAQGGFGDGIEGAEVVDGTATGGAEVADGEMGWDGGAAGGEEEE